MYVLHLPGRNENILFYSPEAVRLVLLSDRAGPVLTLDPMRAGPRHLHLTLTLALLELGQANLRANRARLHPWTAYQLYNLKLCTKENMSIDS